MVFATIEMLNGRSFREIRQMEENMVSTFFTGTHLLDPRYKEGEITSTGQGLQPRNLDIVGMTIGAELLACLAFRRWDWKDRHAVRTDNSSSVELVDL